jgi:dihydrofolate synthase/folylpolyglutamate synthase
MDKMEIAKTGSTLILGKMPTETKRRAGGLAKAKGVEMLSVDEKCELQQIVYGDQTMTLDFLLDGLHFQSVVCSLVGPHQVSNLLLAILLVKKWLEANHFGIESDSFIRAAKRGLERVNWPGRFEKIANTPLTYIDIGHTPDAMQQLVQTARSAIDQPILLVFGVSKGRDPKKMLEPWLPVAADIYLTQASYKGADVYEMKKILNTNSKMKSMDVFESAAQAIDVAFETAKAEGKTIIITGSLFLAIEAKAYLDKIPPSSLHFF